jgi:hypothetical protein
MYKDDGLSSSDIQTLVDTFRGQTLDFFGAVRASTYDCQIRDWMIDVSGEMSQWHCLAWCNYTSVGLLCLPVNA